MNHCECGCGELVRGRFAHGHNGRGARNGRWRGDAIEYSALHKWLIRIYPKTGVCEECGEERSTEYAFQHHPRPHTRDRDDYRELCVPCHRRIDISGSTTTCSRNHEMTDENTYTSPSGERTCRTCRREYSRAWQRKKLNITPDRWRTAA